MADKKETVKVQEHFDEKIKDVKEGKKVNINLTKKVKVEFIKDFGFLKKGDVRTVSQTAFELYNKEKAVKEI